MQIAKSRILSVRCINLTCRMWDGWEVEQTNVDVLYIDIVRIWTPIYLSGMWLGSDIGLHVQNMLTILDL
jgi:hypothetical protein